MPAVEWGWRIEPHELESWILQNDAELLVINKPGLVVCHPSKHGPWSSLIGACREYLGVERLHMPSRLDRETSGVVIFAKNTATASLLQSAIQNRLVTKTYLAILEGQLREPVEVDQPIGPAEGAVVRMRQCVRADGAQSRTSFTPLRVFDSMTLVEVRPHTGRLHQIRVHAQWLGHPVVADKVYGPDERLFAEFVTEGFNEHLASKLPLPRQALHAARLEFHLEPGLMRFDAPLAADLADFLARQQRG